MNYAIDLSILDISESEQLGLNCLIKSKSKININLFLKFSIIKICSLF